MKSKRIDDGKWQADRPPVQIQNKQIVIKDIKPCTMKNFDTTLNPLELYQQTPIKSKSQVPTSAKEVTSKVKSVNNLNSFAKLEPSKRKIPQLNDDDTEINNPLVQANRAKQQISPYNDSVQNSRAQEQTIKYRQWPQSGKKIEIFQETREVIENQYSVDHHEQHEPPQCQKGLDQDKYQQKTEKVWKQNKPKQEQDFKKRGSLQDNLKQITDGREQSINSSNIYIDTKTKFGQLIQILKDHNIQILKENQIINHGIVIGKGAFGVVFKGIWLSNCVAIKEIIVSYDEFKTMSAELQFLSKCRYPTMIQFYGVYIKELTVDQTLQCQLVMELMNTDLDSYIFKDESQKNQKDLIKILFHVAQAISFLHQNDIVHRDIKPQNVLLDSNLCAKLSDLGIAKVLENKQQTQNATLAYTARYASAETALEETTSFKSDIWSFGILTYEVLTGRRAWEFMEKSSRIIIALSKEQSPFIDDWEKLIEIPQLVDLINRTVNYDPAKRIGAEEIQLILDQILHDL